MADTVRIVIDDKQYEVPAGVNLVDAAKRYAQNDIPVFCYHPKMDPVGMCRMCLVEVGAEQRDRATGDLLLDDKGQPQVRWAPKLQTACTERVYNGMHVRTQTPIVTDARKNVIEFLLTSHPLDCPICDKGGECPLQNLTMAFGNNSVSRMYYADKQQLGKDIPLGDLIVLDQERCIQCARCIRFQDEIVGDHVIAFHERARRLQIITESEPGFDSYFSGNTTDICPVGALTTVDFRFGARPWELNEVPSISPWDAAGENISLSTRLDRDFGGRAMIKRVMPRQNEAVNEIWISDKTRFGHHFTRSDDRVQSPMHRSGASLNPTIWNEIFPALAPLIKDAGNDLAAIAGNGLTVEDMWELRRLLEAGGSTRMAGWSPTHASAPIVAEAGVGTGTNFKDMGAGDAILVIASDLEEEVPLWHLRIKGAQDRGAFLLVANARHTRLADFAIDIRRNDRPIEGAALYYDAGAAVQALESLEQVHPELAQRLKDANNLVIVTGAEGLSLAGSRQLAQSAANFLIKSGHVGKANNGLLSTLPGPNGMGLHYLGFATDALSDIAANPPKVLIVAQAELLDDDPDAIEWLSKVETIISLNLFPDKLSELATYVLPIQSFAERDGTYINGERRIQRFYTAQGPLGDAMPAWKFFANLTLLVNGERAPSSAAASWLHMSQNLDTFSGIRYKDLAWVTKQYPDIGGTDLYYGGTAYENRGGLGVQLPTTADNGPIQTLNVTADATPTVKKGEFLIIPSTRLYNRQNNFKPSLIVQPRVLLPHVLLNEEDAQQQKISTGDVVEIKAGNTTVRVRAAVSDQVARGSAVLPRYLSDQAIPLQPTAGSITKVSDAVAVG